MSRGAHNTNWPQSVALLGITFSFAGLAIWLYTRFLPGAFSSDAAVQVLLAKLLLDSHAWISAQWLYPNGDIFAIGPHLLSMALMPSLGVSLANLTWTAVLTFTSLWVCLLLCLIGMGFSKRGAITAACAALACVTDFHAEFIYQQTGYPFLMVLYFTAFTLHARLHQADKTPSSALHQDAWKVLILAAIIVATAVCNPSRTAAYLVVPMMVLDGLAMRSSPTRRLASLAVMVLALIVGYAIYRSWIQQGIHFSLPSGFRHISLDGKRMFLQLRTVLQYPAFVFSGFAMSAMGILLSLGLSISGWVLWRNRSAIPQAGRHVGRLAMWQSAFVLAGGLLSGLFLDRYSVRYFLPAAILLGAILCASAFDELGRRKNRTALILLTLWGAVILNGLATLPQLVAKVRESGPVRLPHVLHPVVAAIEERGLTLGFVEWDANVMNVLSEGRVQFCQTTYRDQLLPFKWNVPTWCYDPSAMPDRLFFVLKPQHDAAARQAVRNTLPNHPIEQFSVNGYEVLVYRTSDTPLDWLAYPVPDGPDLALPWQAPAANPQMFSRVLKPSADRTFEFQGRPGEVVFGPYVNLEKGHYKLTWKGMFSAEDWAQLNFRVQSSNGKKVFAQLHPALASEQAKTLRSTSIEFEMPRASGGVNFLVEQTGTAQGSLNSFTLERISQQSKPQVTE